MNRKILSLLTALLLCVSLFPIQALAAEETPTVGDSHVTDTGTSLGSSRARMRRAAAGDAAIDMSYGGFVFAQGVPIVIREDGDKTRIYDTEGHLLSGDADDVSSRAIYGGWYDGNNEHSANTSITMESGTVGVIYGGSYGGSLAGNTNIELNGGTANRVFGGGCYSTVTGSASVTVNAGAHVEVSVFGGGYNGSVGSTDVVLNGGTIGNGSSEGWIYGGGEGCSIENTHLRLKSGICVSSYGGGSFGGTVEKAVVELGADWNPIYWVFAGGDEDTTNSAEVIIHNYASSRTGSLNIDTASAKDATMIVRRDDGGPQNQPNSSALSLVPTGNWNVVVEYGTVEFLGNKGENLTLKSLDIHSSSQVEFGTFDSITIQKLICNGGQLLLPAHFLSGTSTAVNTPITLEEIVSKTPLILKAEGHGWTEEKLEEFYFFEGPGVDSLTDTDCFFAEDYDIVLKDIPGKTGKGIYLKYKEAEKGVYISKLEFTQNPVTYNGTIPLTVGVGKQLATVDFLELIPNARIQIRGSSDRDVLFADIHVNEDGTAATVTGMDGVTRPAQVNGGYISLELPVNAALLETREEGLYMLTAAPDQYSSSAQLVGPNGEKAIEITPVPITLTGAIPEPAFQDPLQSELEDGAFYTASVRWRPVDNAAASAFQVNREYRADVILTPKEGHWLSAESIGNTVSFGGKQVACVFNTDGTVTLTDLKRVRFEGHIVTVAASPAEGGTVTGGGVYLYGSQVTVKAEPAAGWRFIGWTESGKEIAGTMEYRFSVTGHRNITAVFEKESEELETKLEIQNGISEVPPAFKALEHLNTPEKITLAMRTAITQTGIPSENTVVYEVKLMISMDGGKTWVPASKDNFPAGGLKVTLPYPTGTDSGYTFTVVHMFTTSDFGKIPGDTEKPSVTNTVGGIQFTVTGLSPISIGWVKSGGSSGGDGPSSDGLSEGGTTSGSGHSSSSSTRNDEYDFWQSVRKKIEAAAPGDTVTVSTGDYERMPKSVMDALRKKNGVTLVLRRDDGTEIVIPSEKALDEAMRVYYPLPYLEDIDFSVTEPVLSPEGVTGSKPNPGTGGWNPAWGPVNR